MKLTSITTTSGRAASAAFKAADIGLLHGDDVGMAAQRWMQLLAPDIDENTRLAPLASNTSVKPPVDAPTSRQT